VNLITAWDVSSTRTGFAVVDEHQKVVAVGAWERDNKASRGINLLSFYGGVLSVIQRYPSAFCCMEQQPVLRGMRTTDMIAGFRNIVYMAYEGNARQAVNEIQQTQRFKVLGLKRLCKKAGVRTAHTARKANKAMIMEAVQRFWKWDKLLPHQEDEADALAIAAVLFKEIEASGDLDTLKKGNPAWAGPGAADKLH